MAKSGRFTAQKTWAAAELDGEVITNGTYTIKSLDDRYVGVVYGTALPSQDKILGDDFIRGISGEDSFSKFDLAFGEKAYLRADLEDTEISIIKA